VAGNGLGRKRKQPRQVYRVKNPKEVSTDEMADDRDLVIQQQGAGTSLNPARDEDVISDDSHKKQRTILGSADQAAAGTQPRHSQ
jgi:hypothetical protein